MYDIPGGEPVEYWIMGELVFSSVMSFTGQAKSDKDK